MYSFGVTKKKKKNPQCEIPLEQISPQPRDALEQSLPRGHPSETREPHGALTHQVDLVPHC